MNLSVTKKIALTGHSGAIYALAGTGAPGIFLSGAGDKMVAAWNLAEGAEGKLIAQLPAPVFSLLAVGSNFLAGTGAGSLHVIDTELKRETRAVQLHTAQIFDIAYSPKHNLLFTAGGDGQLVVSEASSAAFLKAKKLTGAKVRNVAVSPDENLAAVTCGDGSVHIFALPGMEEVTVFPAHELSANAACWHPGGNYLLTGGRDAHLKAWDAKNNFKLVKSIPAHNFAIYSIVFSPDEKLFATASRDKTVKLWDAENIALLVRINQENFDGHRNSVNRLLWNETGLISAGDDRSVMVWEVN